MFAGLQLPLPRPNPVVETPAPAPRTIVLPKWSPDAEDRFDWDAFLALQEEHQGRGYDGRMSEYDEFPNDREGYYIR